MQPVGQPDARVVYVDACDPEAVPPGVPALDLVRAELRRWTSSSDEPAREPLADLVREAVAWSARETRRYRELFDRAGDAATRDVLVRRAVLGWAPLGLVCGAWLQWLSAPGNADDPAVLRVLALYAADVGVGRPRAARGSAYLALLRHLALSEYAVPASRIAFDTRIPAGAYYLPSLLLLMSRCPDGFRAEILGADLCLRAAGPPPPLAGVRAALPDATDWRAIDPGAGREPDQPPTVDIACVAATAYPAERVGLGFRWALSALAEWSGQLLADLDAARDPAHEMAELLRRRAREGSVYHAHFQLAGRSLSDWLRDAQADPGPLLSALAASRLVKPGRAADSPLVAGLVSERGPMFRVFASEDLAVIRRWIDALPAAAPAPSPAAQPLRYQLSQRNDAVREDREPANLREAYHRLLGRADTPALRRCAQRYVHGWLARSRMDIGRAENLVPDRWEPEGLRPWLLEQHDRHAAEFARSDALPSKEALVDSTVQLAPLTLIDGAWLQGFTDYEHATSELGHFLFETYWDELGNGEARLNHPLIYREVLAEMGVELPPTASREFAESSILRDASFELPVYWLCIGRMPRTFLPEILGLNLAMELSGVGGSYRRARVALKKYGFSTRFVDIHNTIDNVATGHSAWAADAVDTYLATVSVAQGAAALGETWQRVRTGFRSLNPPSGRRARRVQQRASRRTGAGRA